MAAPRKVYPAVPDAPLVRDYVAFLSRWFVVIAIAALGGVALIEGVRVYLHPDIYRIVRALAYVGLSVFAGVTWIWRHVFWKRRRREFDFSGDWNVVSTFDVPDRLAIRGEQHGTPAAQYERDRQEEALSVEERRTLETDKCAVDKKADGTMYVRYLASPVVQEGTAVIAQDPLNGLTMVGRVTNRGTEREVVPDSERSEWYSTTPVQPDSKGNWTIVYESSPWSDLARGSGLAVERVKSRELDKRGRIVRILTEFHHLPEEAGRPVHKGASVYTRVG